MTHQTITLTIRRRRLTIHPDGSIEGLWEIVRRELRTAQEVRKLCGFKTRATLIAWRAKDFPAPVISYPAKGGLLELWARAEVEAWLRKRKREAR